MSTKPYQREPAVAYAYKWALHANPQYYDYSQIGGDCTNFASQVIYAGSGVMNYHSIHGWYYLNANQKSPSWTGVDFLYQFLVNNQERGPFAEEVHLRDLELGDIIQLSFVGRNDFNHSLVVTRIDQPGNPSKIFVSTHSPKALNATLSSYTWVQIRGLHIKGVYV